MDHKSKKQQVENVNSGGNKTQSRKRKLEHSTDSDDNTEHERRPKALRTSKVASPVSPEDTEDIDFSYSTASKPLSMCRYDSSKLVVTSPADYYSQSSSVLTLSDTSPPSSSVFNLSPSTAGTHTDIEEDSVTADSWRAVKGNETPQSNLSQNSNSTCRYSIPCCVTPSSEQRICTLPRINFAESGEVWKLMCRQDEKGSLERDVSMLTRHKGIQPRMRAILLDWLIEVCEVYKLRRETYYLAVDYLDRYLTNVTQSVLKNHLQLIGITCLFIAAKVEEIYPPKIAEFAYVTDGACCEDDILRQELLILSTLQWQICTVTVVGWISLFMQINVTTNLQNPSIASATTVQKDDFFTATNSTTSNSRVSTTNKTSTSTKTNAKGRRKSVADHLIVENRNAEAFIYPQFTGMQYTQIMQLIDLCSLDVEMAQFPYSVIAAAAISHIFDRTTATRLSGLDWDAIAPCSSWMAPFYQVITEESGPIFLLEQNEQLSSPSGLKHICPNIVTDESHTIQIHRTSLKMFDAAMEQRMKTLESETITTVQPEESPASAMANTVGLLTPPASNRKTLEGEGELVETKQVKRKIKFRLKA